QTLSQAHRMLQDVERVANRKPPRGIRGGDRQVLDRALVFMRLLEMRRDFRRHRERLGTAQRLEALASRAMKLRTRDVGQTTVNRLPVERVVELVMRGHRTVRQIGDPRRSYEQPPIGKL